MIYIVQNLWPILAATLAGLAVGVAHHLATGRAAHAPVATRPPLLLIALVAEFWLACILAGTIMLFWIVGEVASIRAFHVLQVVYLVTGALVVAWTPGRPRGVGAR